MGRCAHRSRWTGALSLHLWVSTCWLWAQRLGGTSEGLGVDQHCPVFLHTTCHWLAVGTAVALRSNKWPIPRETGGRGGCRGDPLFIRDFQSFGWTKGQGTVECIEEKAFKQAAVMSLQEGSRVFICYDLPPPALWHERYILSACACGRGWHIVLTPDRDVFPELISLENEDIAGYRLGDGIQLPVGLTGDNTYRFRNLPGPDEMAQLLRDARHAGLALAFPPGAGGALAAPAAGVQAPAQPVDDGSKWVIVETGDDRRRGDEVTLDGTEILRGHRWPQASCGQLVCHPKTAPPMTSHYTLGVKHQQMRGFWDWLLQGPHVKSGNGAM